MLCCFAKTRTFNTRPEQKSKGVMRFWPWHRTIRCDFPSWLSLAGSSLSLAGSLNNTSKAGRIHYAATPKVEPLHNYQLLEIPLPAVFVCICPAFLKPATPVGRRVFFFASQSARAPAVPGRWPAAFLEEVPGTWREMYFSCSFLFDSVL